MSQLTPFLILKDMNCYMISRAGNRYGKQQFHSIEDLEEAKLNKYLLMQFLISNPMTLNISNYLNENYKTISLYDMYIFSFFAFKRANVGNVYWVKQDKEIKPEDITMIMKYYLCSYKIAYDYIDILEKEDLDYIREYYRIGGKTNKDIGNKV